jgi:hypothetical protein
MVTVWLFAAIATWMLAAMVRAVQQALDFSSTRRAAMVCVLGWAIVVALSITLGLVFSRPVY